MDGVTSGGKPSATACDDRRRVDQKLGVQSLFDGLSATYDSTGVDFFGQIARRLIRHARLREGSVVLDVGCGAGAALIPAAEAVGPTGRVWGIDLAPGMVDRAQRAVQQLALENVRVDVGDAEAPAAPPGSVDAIVASLVLFFLPDIDLALDAYVQALVPGGTFAFSTFMDDDDWTGLDRLLATFTSPEPERDEEEPWFQSESGVRSLLSTHGFRDISVEEVTHQVDFPTIAAFHEWIWSTGWRATWSAIPPKRRHAATAAVDNHLRSLHEQRGRIRLETRVRYTRAATI
jgi:ubiquinone/menaquinone biosynthesis C-methylase UbiE